MKESRHDPLDVALAAIAVATAGLVLIVFYKVVFVW